MKHSTTVLAGILLLAWSVLPAAAANRHNLHDVRLIDADTIEARIDLGFGVSTSGSCRLMGFDAWERTARRRTVNVTPQEIDQGIAATKALGELLKRGQPVAVVTGKRSRDPYGRHLIFLQIRTTNGQVIDVASWMLTHGHDRDHREDGTRRSESPAPKQETTR